MNKDLIESVRVLRATLVAFQPEASGEDSAVLVEELATLEKVCVAARVRAAAHAGRCGAHNERGFADVSDWLARASGSTAGSAKAALDTAAALGEHPEVKTALETGELSLAQAKELLRTEAEVPGSAGDLLDIAKQNSLKTLKEKARDRRVRAIDPEELHALQRAAMSGRHWINKLGNTVWTVELPPEFGVPFTTRLEAETDRIWQEHRRAANRQRRNASAALAAGQSPRRDRQTEPPRASRLSEADGQSDRLIDDDSTGGLIRRRPHMMAEAFLRMLETGGKGKAHQPDMIIVCDLRAYRRGYAEEGEPCNIVGGGPIPVSLARELARDAFLKAVLHDGEEIHTIAHFGRRYPAVLRTALMLGAPPSFEGRICADPGCDRRYHLENDHVDPCNNGGKTSYENLAPRCWPHHQQKTGRDRQAGLLTHTPRGPDQPPPAAVSVPTCAPEENRVRRGANPGIRGGRRRGCGPCWRIW